MTMSDTVAPVVVHGLRCGEPMHYYGYGYGKVFCTSRSLVVSTDGGQTWARAEP